jgi:hypothetical protein
VLAVSIALVAGSAGIAWSATPDAAAGATAQQN